MQNHVVLMQKTTTKKNNKKQTNAHDFYQSNWFFFEFQTIKFADVQGLVFFVVPWNKPGIMTNIVGSLDHEQLWYGHDCTG